MIMPLILSYVGLGTISIPSGWRVGTSFFPERDYSMWIAALPR